jgi:two-component system, NarL family, sensor kinase
MSPIRFEKQFFAVSSRTRWVFIILAFTTIAILDFSTPPEYILAYLYAIPIVISVSFLKPHIAKALLALALAATLLNLILPSNVAHVPSVLVNRLLAVLSIGISAFFIVRYIRYQEQIQEQERLLATERNLSQMREDFIATLSHDLKTPLLGGQKTLQYLLEEAFGPLNEEQKQVLEALVRSNHRQTELVESLLSAYRNDILGVEVRMTLVDMDELIADILTEVQYLGTERGIKLEYACRRTPPKIKGEPAQLKRVVANLIHNALNYTPSSGTIQVILTEHEGHLRIEVIDTGPGLPKEDLEDVFHRFYRSGGERQVVGTGLGLYLSRQLINAHRGKIWAENIAPQGCKFSFTLPIAATDIATERNI